MLEALFWDHNGDFQSATAVAAVALIGAVISAVFSWLSYKNSVKTTEGQYIMEQRKVDASLKAKARIEWVIGVRDKTSELVSSLLSLQKEKTVFYEQWLEIEKVSELLKLYLNSKMNKKVNSEIYIEQNEIIISETATSIVLKENNNISKHAYIKKYIERLVELYKDNSYKNIPNKIRSYHDSINKLYEDNSEYWISHEQSELEKIKNAPPEELEGEDYDYVAAEKNIKYYQRKIKDIEVSLTSYHKAIDFFTTVISLYLKIEWDKAKEGQ